VRRKQTTEKWLVKRSEASARSILVLRPVSSKPLAVAQASRFRIP